MMTRTSNTIYATKFMLERRLIEILTFLQEASGFLTDFPNHPRADNLRRWI